MRTSLPPFFCHIVSLCVVLWDKNSSYWHGFVFPCTIVNLLDYTKIIICLMRSKLYYVFQNNNLVVLHWKKLKYAICKFIEAYMLIDLTIIITWTCCCCNCLQCTSWYSTLDCSTRFFIYLNGGDGKLSLFSFHLQFKPIATTSTRRSFKSSIFVVSF